MMDFFYKSILHIFDVANTVYGKIEMQKKGSKSA